MSKSITIPLGMGLVSCYDKLYEMSIFCKIPITGFKNKHVYFLWRDTTCKINQY